MHIKMKTTVEDSHKYAATDAKGDPVILFDVRKFRQGEEYDDATGGPDWERRAQGFLDQDLADRLD